MLVSSGRLKSAGGKLAVLLALLAACGDEEPEGSDGGDGHPGGVVADAASGDSPADAAVPADAGASDAGAPDADVPDAAADAGPTVALEIALQGGGEGTVSATDLIDCGSRCTATVPPGTHVVLTAAAVFGSAFVGWGGDDPVPSVCSSDPVCELDVNFPLRVTAEFEHEVRLTAAVTGPGQVLGYGDGGGGDDLFCPDDCEASGVLPERFFVSAAPRLGCLFEGWTGACSGQDRSCELDLAADAPTSLLTTATFRQMYNWSFQVGGPSLDSGSDLAVSSEGDIAVVGNIDLDAWVALYTAGGAARFRRLFPSGTFIGLAEAVAFDPDGNVVVAGRFTGTLDLGGEPLVAAGSYDIFLAGFTPGGVHLWSQRWGDEASQVPRALEIAPDGSILMAGAFDGTLSFGATPMTSAGGWDSFAVRLAPDRSEVWATHRGTEDADESVRKVLPLTDGGAVLLGNLDANGGLALARVDATGTVAWIEPRPFGSADGFLDNQGFGLAATPSGDLIVSSMSDVANQRATSLARYALDGGLVQEIAFDEVEVHDLAVDSIGDVVLVGKVHSGGGVGGPPLPITGLRDVLIAKLDPTFAHRWSFAFGDSTFSQYGSRVDTGPGDTIFFTGNNGAGILDLGPGPMSAMTNVIQVFIASFRP